MVHRKQAGQHCVVSRCFTTWLSWSLSYA
uniref:Uncharacterized protein n=1 Tax=Arundo donax TaxID=35708 RepID=A0A0A8ZYX4_ARUDO